MEIKYTIENNGVIWYEENGFRYSFMPDPANSDYQAYLASLEAPTVQHTLCQDSLMNLVQKAVQHNGRLSPLIIPAEITNGTGLMICLL